jgi:hypothetical protein
MTLDREGETRSALAKLLDEYGLSGETRLYREVTADSLTPTETPGIFRVRANPTPSESVIDVYGQGYLVQAQEVGPGLAFAESASPDWQETMELRALRARGASGATSPPPIEVEIRLDDILRQGGLIYPVESVTVERVWYCTLPSDSVDVRTVS